MDQVQAIEELRWYFGRWFEGDMGRRGLDPSRTTGGSEPARRGHSERELSASARLRRVEPCIRALSHDTQHVLRLAYGEEQPPSLAAYGSAPRSAFFYGARTVLHCPLTREEYARSQTTKPLYVWLGQRAEQARNGKGLDKERAQRLVDRLREATCAMVAAAVSEYAGAEVRTPGPTITVEEIAQRTGLTVRHVRLRLGQLEVERARRGRALLVRVGDLRVKWSDAAP